MLDLISRYRFEKLVKEHKTWHEQSVERLVLYGHREYRTGRKAVFLSLLIQAQAQLGSHGFRFKNRLYCIDSTTIEGIAIPEAIVVVPYGIVGRMEESNTRMVFYR